MLQGDRFLLAADTNAPWAFPLGTNVFDGLLVSSSGARSRFAWWLSPYNSLVLTWRDFLLDRSPDSPVSFQAEFLWNGDFVYRYACNAGGAQLVAPVYNTGGSQPATEKADAINCVPPGTPPGEAQLAATEKADAINCVPPGTPLGGSQLAATDLLRPKRRTQ